MAEQGPLSGQILGGKYRIGELLGEGGIGMVYAGQHLLLDRPQAIKFLLEHHSRQPKFRERFLKEAKIVAALDHRHIVHIYDFGMEEQTAKAYLVMPFIRGGTFSDILKKAKKEQKFLEMEQVVFYAEQISSALDYAHQCGVVHLDLKPQNLLVHDDGRLLLADFGLAHLVDEESLEGGSSRQLGTPYYMAPEHINGHPRKQSDVYALGIMLYQMLVGRGPFEGQGLAVMAKHITELPPPLQTWRSELPLELEEVLKKALAKEAGLRYQSAGELLVAFKDALVRAQKRASEAEKERLRKAEQERVRLAKEAEQARLAEKEQRRKEEERLRQEGSWDQQKQDDWGAYQAPVQPQRSQWAQPQVGWDAQNPAQPQQQRWGTYQAPVQPQQSQWAQPQVQPQVGWGQPQAWVAQNPAQQQQLQKLVEIPLKPSNRREEAGEWIVVLLQVFEDNLGWGGVFNVLGVSISLGLWQKNWWIFLGSLLCSVILFTWGKVTEGRMIIVIFAIIWSVIGWLIGASFVGTFQASIGFITFSVGSHQQEITLGQGLEGVLAVIGFFFGFFFTKRTIDPYWFRFPRRRPYWKEY